MKSIPKMYLFFFVQKMLCNFILAQHDKLCSTGHNIYIYIHFEINIWCNLAAIGTDVFFKVLTMMERKLNGHNVFMAG